MAFDTLSPRLKVIAEKSLAHFRSQYGGNGLQTEQGIHSAISWRPTFYMKPSRFSILAFEVDDNLYPEALKGAAHDIDYFNSPISVYQVCSLEAYQSDPKQTKVNLLRKHGFGIATVDDDGTVTVQHSCIPLAQNISPDTLEAELKGLNSVLKVKFRAAHVTYRTNEGQGLQQAGQIVEGLIHSIAQQAANRNVIPPLPPSPNLANVIDSLYTTSTFANHRAALGGTRDFIKEFRNTASHAPRSAADAAEKIRKCRLGFLEAVSVAKKLKEVTRQMGYRAVVFTT